MNLTADQLDVLKETFNIGVGRAAASLMTIIDSDQEMELSVPEVMLITLDEMEQSVTQETGPSVNVVTQQFEGSLTGMAMLVYSERQSLELVRLLLGRTVGIEEISEMEAEALCEVGNIVLNACLATMSNLMGGNVDTQVPRLNRGDLRAVLSRLSPDGDLSTQVLYLRIRFVVQTHGLSGHIGFTLDTDTVLALVEGVQSFYGC